jgi:hypothetical protein
MEANDMTGVAAGAATGGDGGQQGDGQQGGEGAGTGPDFAALQSMLDSQGQQLGEMRDFLQSNPWGEIQQAAQDTGGEQDQFGAELDLGFLDPAVAATMDPDQLSAKLGEQMQAAARSEAEKLVQAQVAPLQQQIAEQQRSQEVNALIGEFPELAEAETAQQVLGAAGQLAEQLAPGLAASLGLSGQERQIAEALAASPGFWRSTYMAGRAADAAQEEGGDVESPATLESGAGATPGGGQGDLGDQIIGARRGSSVLPFG